MKTDKFYVSFWSDGDVKKELGVVSTALLGVKGCLVFHHELDRSYEGDRSPTATHHIVNVTDEAINGIYEEFLRFNDIDPEDVTLEMAEVLLDEGLDAERAVPITRYTFLAATERESKTLFDDMRQWNDSGVCVPFYQRKQSCVSFCFNLINAASLNPRVRNPRSQMRRSLSGLGSCVNPSSPPRSQIEPMFSLMSAGLASTSTVNPFELFQSPSSKPEPSGIYTVPWFEKYVVEHWVADATPANN